MRLSFSFGAEVKLSTSSSLNWQELLDIFSAMNGCPILVRHLWVGLSQKFQQVFFTSRSKPAELRKSIPRRVRFPFAFGRIKNLVKTYFPSMSTSPVVC
ncbi:hypothetical protein TNCV_3883961 [Trichonephila clavipes]|nr:hypothetical protein TNCV_3883961 [Trichonephila clavipes]